MNFPADLRYTKDDEWIKMDGNTATIGITDFAQEQLGDLVYIELPELGRIIRAQEQCAVVESVKTASDLYSPVSGEVVAVNLALVDEPEKVNEDPYGAWIFCVEADDLSGLDQLMNADAYQLVIEQ